MWQDVCGVRLCDAVELERVGAVVWEILPTIEGSAIEARSKDLKDPTPINRAPNSPTPGRTGGGGHPGRRRTRYRGALCVRRCGENPWPTAEIRHPALAFVSRHPNAPAHQSELFGETEFRRRAHLYITSLRVRGRPLEVKF